MKSSKHILIPKKKLRKDAVIQTYYVNPNKKNKQRKNKKSNKQPDFEPLAVEKIKKKNNNINNKNKKTNKKNKINYDKISNKKLQEIFNKEFNIDTALDISPDEMKTFLQHKEKLFNIYNEFIKDTKFKKEALYLIDDKFNIIKKYKGNHNSVVFDVDEVNNFAKTHNIKYTIHNHPVTDLPFSTVDLIAYKSLNIKKHFVFGEKHMYYTNYDKLTGIDSFTSIQDAVYDALNTEKSKIKINPNASNEKKFLFGRKLANNMFKRLNMRHKIKYFATKPIFKK